VNSFALLTLSVFALIISTEDLRNFRIRNRDLLILLAFLLGISLIESDFFSRLISGFIFFCIFGFVYLLSMVFTNQLGIGFGDVKLMTVLAFGFINSGASSIEIFFLSLCCALLVQISLLYLYRRKFPSRMAMAPSIFFAIGLYLYAPMGLLLPQ
jgi:Flp pilus assembly protein protease CpaA